MGGRQFAQNCPKLHENYKIGIFGSKQSGGGGGGGGKPIFRVVGGDRPPTRGNPATTETGRKDLKSTTDLKTNTGDIFLNGAIHKGCPHLVRWRGVSQRQTAADMREKVQPNVDARIEKKK